MHTFTLEEFQSLNRAQSLYNYLPILHEEPNIMVSIAQSRPIPLQRSSDSNIQGRCRFQSLNRAQSLYNAKIRIP